MAPQSVYTLHDFQTYVGQRFSQAFKIMNAMNSYTFLHNPPNRKITAATSHDRLLLAHFSPQSPEVFEPVRVAFSSSDNTVRYYIGSLESHLVLKTYPLGAMSLESHLAPFRFLAPHNWRRKGTEENASLRTETIERLTLLVKFAFLLTGRINQIKSNDGRDLLLEFEEICGAVEKALQAEEEKKKERAQREQEKKNDNDTAEATELDTLVKLSVLEVGLSADVPARGLKGAVASFGVESAELNPRHNDTDTDKQHKSSHLQSVAAPATLDPAIDSVEATDRADTMRNLLVTVAEHHKKQLLETRAQERQASSQQIGTLKRLLEAKEQEETASRKEIEMLKTRLSEKEEEADEWKAKFLKLDARVQGFVRGE